MPATEPSDNLVKHFIDVRKEIHRNPELGFDTVKTAAVVARELRALGITQVETGVARNGVVAVIDGKLGAGRTLGLRADMDALPIKESADVDYPSQFDGLMHACGHDGHTSSLLLAAAHLADGNFYGRVVLLFQPAEEGGGGGRVMVEEGVFDRYNIDEVYAYHNLPNMPLGSFAIRKGTIMAAVDGFEITVNGVGGHAAFPEDTVDPIPVMMRIIDAIYAIKTRQVAATDPIVISITRIDAGTSSNVIPSSVKFQGTLRSLDPDTRKRVMDEIERLSSALAEAMGASATIRSIEGYPPTVNTPAETNYAVQAARALGADVDTEVNPTMGAEDFSYMLEVRPGAYMLIGNGEGAMIHNPDYVYNDGLLPIAANWFVSLVHTRLGAPD